MTVDLEAAPADQTVILYHNTSRSQPGDIQGSPQGVTTRHCFHALSSMRLAFQHNPEKPTDSNQVRPQQVPAILGVPVSCQHTSGAQLGIAHGYLRGPQRIALFFAMSLFFLYGLQVGIAFVRSKCRHVIA